MNHYHAVMLDETRCEFGVGVVAKSKAHAREQLAENYPESRIVQIESAKDTADRENAMYQHIYDGGDWDDEGRPIFHHSQRDWDNE